MLTAVVFLGLSSLTASAPHFRADRHGASFYEGTPAGLTGVSDSKLATVACASIISWNDTVRFPRLHGHSVPSVLPHSSQHIQQSEEPKAVHQPCSCEHTHDDIAKTVLEAAASITQYRADGAEVASISVRRPVNTSSSYDIKPVAPAIASVVACGLGAVTTIFVTETVAVTLTSGGFIHFPPLNALLRSNVNEGFLPPLSSLQATPGAAPTEQFTSSSLSKPSLPALPLEGCERDAGLQTNTLSTVIIFETLTVIPLPAPSETSYQGLQQEPNDISPELSSSGHAVATSTFGASTNAPLVINEVDSSSVPIIPPPPIKFASSSSVVVPVLAGTNLHGASYNKPSTQYIRTNFTAVPRLPINLTVGVNGALSTEYGISPSTGVLEADAMAKSRLANLTGAPRLSRDGGKGGYLNGRHLFVFRDTRSYTSTGEFIGIVSSSVATDSHMNGLSGKPLELEDGIGEWSDNAGRLRGFAPMTTGEQAYNILMQGRGQRYAVWPESSIIPFNKTHALMYAPIIYNNVNMRTQNGTFTYTGNTLLAITAGGEGGPRAERIVGKLFGQDDVEWGVIGGLRSYGPSGIGGNDGRVYIFGRVKGGLLVGRVDAGQVASRSSYEYWTGTTWSPQPPSPTSTSAYALPGTFGHGDIFYSPTYLTFLFVYLNPYANNTFYYRYLKAPSAILPSATSDFVENIVRYGWSEERVLYKVPAGLDGKHIYSGGVQVGYYGADDVSNGGKKVMLSWTASVELKPRVAGSEYEFVTAEILFA